MKYPVLTQSDLDELLTAPNNKIANKYPCVFAQVVGDVITKIYSSEDFESLVFECTDGFHHFYTDADCCSESWFADIFGFSNLIGATVLSAQEISLDAYNEADGRERQECDKIYGYRLITSKGIAVVSFRNSSNGYYGGRYYSGGKTLLLDKSKFFLIEADEFDIWQSD